MSHEPTANNQSPRLLRRGCCALLVWSTLACAQAPADDGLALQWRLLRVQKGHFDGAAWNDDVDLWQGRKHQLMQALAQRARDQAVPEATLLQWMGPPDAEFKSGQPAYADAVQRIQWQGTPRGDLLVYNWRARHDRLLLAVHLGRVVASGWLLTLE
jgi:hypothetical protein